MQRPGARKLIALAVIVLMAAFYLNHRLGARSGKAIFRAEGCTSCHSFKGTGLGAMDLTGVGAKRSDAWIRDQIIDARRHDPDSGMPRFGHLSDEEVDALIRFLRD